MHPTADPHASAPAAPVRAAWPAAAPERPPGILIGREPELATLRRLVHGADTLISLVGAGGVGKSRLAAELACEQLEPFAGRVAFVALDGVSDPSLVLPAIGGALGVTDVPGRPLHDALAEELGRAPTLLVLDTVEHVLPAAPAMAELAARTPGLRMLVTTRIALGVPRERIAWTEPLPVPPEIETDPESIAATPAAALFIERAMVVRPEFELTPTTAALVAAICRRLDGIPLAIELAAAALRVLAPHQLLDQLEDRLAHPLEEATTALRDPSAPTRRRSLRAAMDWSVGLLPDPVMRLHRRLAVLAGAFDAAVAAELLEGGARRGLAPLGIDLREGLGQLVSASLLRSVGDGTEPWSMLTTVRADALERLDRSGEGIAMRWAHAYQVLALAEAAEAELPTEREVEALDRLDAAHDDIREALDWATRAGDGTFAVRLAGALSEFWRTRGHLTEGRLRLAAALALATHAPAAARRKALAGAGLLASYQGDYPLGESYLREALAVARAEDDREAMAVVLNWLGTNSYGAGRLDDAEAFIVESLELRRALDDDAGVAIALNALAGVHHFRGELDRARELFRESLEIKERLGNENAIAVSLTNLGLVERDAGRPDEAAVAFGEAIAIWTRTGDRQRLAVGIHNTALIALDAGRHDEAAELLDRAYAAARELGDRTETAYAQADRARLEVERGDLAAAGASLAEALPRAVAIGSRAIVPLGLEGAAALANAAGDDRLAARLWAAAGAERAASGYVNMPADQRLIRVRVERSQAALGEAWAAAWSEGSAWSVPQAVDAALRLAASVASPAPVDVAAETHLPAGRTGAAV